MSIVTVNFVGMNICYDSDDYALKDMLKDSRATLVEAGSRMAPPHDIDLAKFGVPAEDPLFIIMTHLWSNGIEFTFLDIGANTGLIMAYMANFTMRCGRRTPIHAFEPGSAFAALEGTVAANELQDQCFAYKMAMSEEPGEMVLIQVEGNTSAASLLPALREHLPGIPFSEERVRVTTVDDFVDEKYIEGALVCKIDTEGNDFRVIRGAKKAIYTRLVPLFIEFIPSLVRSYADPVAELQDLARGYVLIDASDRAGEIKDMAAYVAGVAHKTDIIAVPRKMPNLERLLGKLVAA